MISRTILLSTLLAIFIAGEIVEAADKWLQVQSTNFLRVGNASEGQMRRVGRRLEEFRAALGILFPGIGQRSAKAAAGTGGRRISGID
ncbi:MAG: hypothetical protein HY646_14810 [Acidobacteria bacterium]|nr:hypothetical protein [Acidobacteriota bacterium]